MQKEKLAAIGLVIIIVGALSAYILVTYSEEIFENLFGGEEEIYIIEIGDCVDVNYIGRLASNNSIFDSSYVDVDNKTEGFPLNIFVSLNIESIPPEGYEAYSVYPIEGFMDGLIGLKEGESATIGPIPPEKAYGVKPQVGDVITIPGQTPEDKDQRIDVVEIMENSPMPEEYISFFGDQNTTIYNLRANYSIGEEIPFYPSWENATFVTKVNETMVWTYTTPPMDQRENFTWIDNATQLPYWENASSITSMDDTTIIIKHSPEIGATMDYSVDLVSLTTYTVVNLIDNKINVSYIDSTGNTSYSEFDRIITIERNVTQVILTPFPEEGLEQLLAIIKIYYNPDLEYSLDDLAGETLLYELEIVKVYKTS